MNPDKDAFIRKFRELCGPLPKPLKAKLQNRDGHLLANGQTLPLSLGEKPSTFQPTPFVALDRLQSFPIFLVVQDMEPIEVTNLRPFLDSREIFEFDVK